MIKVEDFHLYHIYSMAVTYVTVAELKADTQNDALSNSGTTEITALIELAEVYIDSFAGYWTKYDSSQTRLFPRDKDIDENGATFIPTPVKKATIAQVEFLFLKSPDAEHGIMEDEEPTKEVISPRAKQLMRGYRMRSGRIVYPENQNIENYN